MLILPTASKLSQKKNFSPWIGILGGNTKPVGASNRNDHQQHQVRRDGTSTCCEHSWGITVFLRDPGPGKCYPYTRYLRAGYQCNQPGYFRRGNEQDGSALGCNSRISVSFMCNSSMFCSEPFTRTVLNILNLSFSGIQIIPPHFITDLKKKKKKLLNSRT